MSGAHSGTLFSSYMFGFQGDGGLYPLNMIDEGYARFWPATQLLISSMHRLKFRQMRCGACRKLLRDFTLSFSSVVFCDIIQGDVV